MRTAMTCLILPALLGLAFAPAPFPKPQRGNLLVNGSFEEGPAVDRWVTLGVNSKDVKGWVVTRAGIDVVGNYWQAAHGSRSIDLHGSPGFGGISQTFATTPGRTYAVRFSMAANPYTSVYRKVMGVSAAGQSAKFTFDAYGKSRQSMGWEIKTWRFTATQNRTTLELYTLMQTEEFSGPTIDDVQVHEVR